MARGGGLGSALAVMYRAERKGRAAHARARLWCMYRMLFVCCSLSLSMHLTTVRNKLAFRVEHFLAGPQRRRGVKSKSDSAEVGACHELQVHRKSQFGANKKTKPSGGESKGNKHPCVGSVARTVLQVSCLHPATRCAANGTHVRPSPISMRAAERSPNTQRPLLFPPPSPPIPSRPKRKG